MVVDVFDFSYNIERLKYVKLIFGLLIPNLLGGFERRLVEGLRAGFCHFCES